MIHLRVIVTVDLAPTVVDHLRATPGVAHVMHLPGAAVVPPGDVVLCDVAREVADEVVEWLQDRGVHHSGAITAEVLSTVVSDAAERAEAVAPGHGEDALIWEELESRAREDSEVTGTFLVFSAVAAVIAAVGILLDSPVLVVGAMVVGPEYGPLAAVCVAAARKRWRPRAALTLLAGLTAAASAALVATALFRVTDLAPDGYEVSDRQLTAFISHPDGLAAVVALLAGIAGMLSLTRARAATLVGVLVSVTTIPAAAAIGVATAYAEWNEVGGAALQLAINVAGLVVAGIATLVIQARLTSRRQARARRRSRQPDPDHGG